MYLQVNTGVREVVMIAEWFQLGIVLSGGCVMEIVPSCITFWYCSVIEQFIICKSIQFCNREYLSFSKIIYYCQVFITSVKKMLKTQLFSITMIMFCFVFHMHVIFTTDNFYLCITITPFKFHFHCKCIWVSFGLNIKIMVVSVDGICPRLLVLIIIIFDGWNNRLCFNNF